MAGDGHMVAVMNLTFKNHGSEPVLHLFLYHALERARTIDRVIAPLCQPFPRGVIKRQRNLFIFQQRLNTPHLNIHNRPHMLAGEAVEENHFIEPVEEFWAEGSTHHLHHFFARGIGNRAFFPLTHCG